MEFPELYQHIDKVERYIGREVTQLKPENSFKHYLLEKEITRGPNIGKHGFGWPRPWRRWCTRVFKERSTRDYLRERYAGCETIKYIGIAYDEPNRHERKKEDVLHPLFDWQITEAQALAYCYSKGFDWGGLYDKFKRLGCWCCPMQQLRAIKTLWRYYPDLWAQLKEIDAKAPYSFLPDYSVERLERRFVRESLQGALWEEEWQCAN